MRDDERTQERRGDESRPAQSDQGSGLAEILRRLLGQRQSEVLVMEPDGRVRRR